jgi:uncharacterized protein (DUF983 family)
MAASEGLTPRSLITHRGMTPTSDRTTGKHVTPAASPRRNTETALELPTLGRALRVLGRTVALRCPHCGVGPVLRLRGTVRDRCSGCNLRFERSDDNYFGGAMFIGLVMGNFTFGLILLVVIVAMWPNVPWDTMTYAIPALMIVVLALLIPISKVAWLAVDILVRPVQPEEIV